MNEIKVGLFTLVAIGLIVFMSIQITTNQSGFGEHTSFRAIIDDATGIFPKTSIKIAGINSGRIKSIELTGSRALITFEVKSSIVLRKKSILRVKSLGLLGEKYLDIFMGDPKAPPLVENDFIITEMGGGVDGLTQDASDILKDLKVVMKSIKEAVSPEGQESPLRGIVKDLEEIAENTKFLTQDLREFIGDNKPQFEKIVTNLEKLTDNLEFHTNDENPEALMADLKKIGPVLDDAKKAMGDVSVIIGDVKKGRGTVGKLLRDEEIVDKVTETLAGVNRLVNRVNMMQTELSMFTQVGSEISQTTQVNLDLNTSPERFYRFGLVTSEVGVKKEKEIQTAINGGDTVTETRSEFYKNSYRFNFQLGRKWSQFAVRAGIIETTGGFGADYFLGRYGNRLSLEVFDYRKSIGPNVRFMTEFHIWNVFYLRALGEDLVSKHTKANFALGGGLRFTDDDIGRLLAFLF